MRDKVFQEEIQGRVYQYILTRDKHGTSRRLYKRVCATCGKEEWLRVAWIRLGRVDCRSCVAARGPSEEVRKKISKTLRAKFSSPSYKELFRRRMLEQNRRGDRHWNWKGGITAENQKGRNHAEILEWKRRVFERDLYHCRVCGVNGQLHAHHIRPYATFPELRTEESNGMTLCESCHRTIHVYFREVEKNGTLTEVE